MPVMTRGRPRKDVLLGRCVIRYAADDAVTNGTRARGSVLAFGRPDFGDGGRSLLSPALRAASRSEAAVPGGHDRAEEEARADALVHRQVDGLARVGVERRGRAGRGSV